MTIINADAFLEYLIFSKHIDSLNCKEVREAIEMSKVNVLDKIRTEIEQRPYGIANDHVIQGEKYERAAILEILDKYKTETKSQEYEPRKLDEKKSDDCVVFTLSNIKDILGKLEAKCNPKYGRDSIYSEALYDFAYEFRTLKPVTCKDCKHWKDSDGVYRRGIDAESKCPINIKEVYEGNFYCRDFKKRDNKDE